MTTLPLGTQTFLMTDIVGSTKLFERDEAAMLSAVARHDALLSHCVARHQGMVIKHRLEGDSFFVAFARASDAVASAVAMQRALAAEPWPEEIPVRVRMAIHSGEAQLRGDDYFGLAVSRCARLREIAHGGQVLLSNAAHALVDGRLPTGVEVKHLGRHALRDLQQIDEVHQLVVAGLIADFPPLASLDAFPNNLPDLLSSFVGRAHELETTGHLLHSGRLLTLTGAGGTGKTRLALQLAAHNIERFDDGVWVVDLASVVDASDVPRAVAAAVGVHEVPGIALERTILDHVGASRELIILDNCEHLQHACVALIEPLLARCPNAHVLATSRQPLDLAGELVYRVPEMSLPPTSTDAANRPGLDDSDAVELFVERARASEHRFELTDANALQVAELCWLLDGIPLSIELAAPMVRVLDLGDIVVRLQRYGLRDLKSRDPTVDERHASVERMIRWSYELCSPTERTFFERLAVFVEAFSLDAVEAICVGGEVLEGEVFDLMTSLIDQSLATKVVTPAGVRYRLLWTVREYAARRLTEHGDAEVFQARHAAYYAQLAVDAGPRLGGREQQALQERLGAEGANLELALTTLRATGQVERALEMAAALWRLWYLRGQYGLGRKEIEQCLALVEGRDSTSDTALALYGAGTLASFQGEAATAIGHLERAIALYRQLDDALGEARALNSVGAIHLSFNRYDAAREALQRSLTTFEAVDDPAALAAIRYNLASVHEGLAEYEQAHSQAEECLRQFQRVGNRSGVARCWTLLGLIAMRRGLLDQAFASYDESLVIFQGLEDAASVAEVHLRQGLILLHQGELQHADKALRLAHYRFRRLGLRSSRAVECYYAQAMVALAMGSIDRAASLINQGLANAGRLDDQWLSSFVYEGLARVAMHRGEFTAARQHFAVSLRLALASAGLQRIFVTALSGPAQLMSAEGLHVRAAALAAGVIYFAERLAVVPFPRDAAVLDAVQRAARAELGDAGHADAVASVRSWPWPTLIAAALSAMDPVAGEPPTGSELRARVGLLEGDVDLE